MTYTSTMAGGFRSLPRPFVHYLSSLFLILAQLTDNPPVELAVQQLAPFATEHHQQSTRPSKVRLSAIFGDTGGFCL